VYAVTVVKVERTLHRPPENVFNFVATNHFQNHPRWDPDLLEMKQTSPGPVQVGTTAHVVRRQGRRTVDGKATVTEYQPNRSAAWEVEFGPFLLRQRVELAPENDGADTRLQLSIDTRARGPIKVIVPLLRGRFRRTMEQSLTTIGTLLDQT
jgi:Polyketide cyclase / dehydrase and lipid transport